MEKFEKIYIVALELRKTCFVSISERRSSSGAKSRLRMHRTRISQVRAIQTGCLQLLRFLHLRQKLLEAAQRTLVLPHVTLMRIKLRLNCQGVYFNS